MPKKETNSTCAMKPRLPLSVLVFGIFSCSGFKGTHDIHITVRNCQSITDKLVTISCNIAALISLTVHGEPHYHKPHMSYRYHRCVTYYTTHAWLSDDPQCEHIPKEYTISWSFLLVFSDVSPGRLNRGQRIFKMTYDSSTNREILHITWFYGHAYMVMLILELV